MIYAQIVKLSDLISLHLVCKYRHILDLNDYTFHKEKNQKTRFFTPTELSKIMGLFLMKKR